ncbi:hypothetical protein KIPB_010226, partial [Kipferlia bialata]|eukprot:g10226.t1
MGDDGGLSTAFRAVVHELVRMDRRDLASELGHAAKQADAQATQALSLLRSKDAENEELRTSVIEKSME